MSGKDIKQVTDAFPTVRCFGGGDRQLDLDDMVKIEDLISVGGTVDTCAVELGLTVAGFKSAMKVSSRIQEAVKRGRAKDKHSYMTALRNKSLQMDNAALTIWHGKQAYGMMEKQAVQHENPPTIVVNTGIPPINPGDSTVIEHE